MQTSLAQDLPTPAQQGATESERGVRRPPGPCQVTLRDILAVHGECDVRPGVPAFSQWFRLRVRESFCEFDRVARLSHDGWRQLTGLTRPTVRALRKARTTPTWRTIAKLIAAQVIDYRTGAPNVALARRMQPRGRVARWRRGERSNWGVGEALQAWRRARGYTQQDALELLGATTSRQLSSWELGRTLPAPHTLALLVSKAILDRATALAIFDSGHFSGTPYEASAHAGTLDKVSRTTGR